MADFGEMIGPAMAVAAIGEVRRDRSEQASAARFARAAALVADSIIFGVISFVVNNVFGVNTVTSGVISTAGGFPRSHSPPRPHG